MYAHYSKMKTLITWKRCQPGAYVANAGGYHFDVIQHQGRWHLTIDCTKRVGSYATKAEAQQAVNELISH